MKAPDYTKPRISKKLLELVKALIKKKQSSQLAYHLFEYIFKDPKLKDKREKFMEGDTILDCEKYLENVFFNEVSDDRIIKKLRAFIDNNRNTISRDWLKP
jgi:hypothetical protein